MSSSIHFRFKSARQFETLSFDGDFLKVSDLKLAIVERKKLNFGEGFDLEIKDASTNDGKFVQIKISFLLSFFILKTKSNSYILSLLLTTNSIP